MGQGCPHWAGGKAQTWISRGGGGLCTGSQLPKYQHPLRAGPPCSPYLLHLLTAGETLWIHEAYDFVSKVPFQILFASSSSFSLLFQPWMPGSAHSSQGGLGAAGGMSSAVPPRRAWRFPVLSCRVHQVWHKQGIRDSSISGTSAICSPPAHWRNPES